MVGVSFFAPFTLYQGSILECARTVEKLGMNLAESST